MAELTEAVAKGDQRVALEALRDKLAEQIEAVEGRYVAALARQLQDVLKTLAGMAQPKGSAVDEIAKRRAERRKAPVAARSKGKVVGGARGSGAGGKRGAAS